MKQTLLTILVCILTTFLVVKYLEKPASQGVAKETTYERVMRTSTLRCAYIVYPPETSKDINTGELSGVVVDLTNAAAKQLGWEVDWVAEVGFADMFDGFKTGKYDALCSGLWESPARAKSALFTIPVNYGVYYAFVRADDVRFDQSFEPVKRRNVKIAVIDGEYGDIVARESFSEAKTHRLPQLSDISQVLLSVSTGKADIAFLQKGAAQGFLLHNPNKLKIIERPVRVMPAPAIALAPHEQELKNTLDAAFRFLLNNGTVEHVLRQYNPKLDSYKLVAEPYQK